MKSKKVAMILSMALCMSMSVSGASVYGEETKTETEQQTDEAEDSGKEEKAEDFTITAGDQTIDVKNETSVTVKEAVYEADKDKETGTLSITEEKGTVHTFENVVTGNWQDTSMTEEFGFVYIKYKDEKDQDVELVETADEKTLEKPVKVYSMDNVNVRSEAKLDAKAQYVTKLGEEAEVTAVVPGWLKVKIGDKEGYVYHSFFTDDKEKADAEIEKKRKAAQEAAAQQAAAQAQQAAEEAPVQTQTQTAPVQQPQASQPDNSAGQTQPQEVYEVSREAYDDCDGSGHGYYEITYSDGSVAIEEY